MLYKQKHRNRIHIYWSLDNKISNRISLGKLDEIEDIITIFFSNNSRNKKAVAKILEIFDRENLVEFLEQDKKTILLELKEVKDQI